MPVQTKSSNLAAKLGARLSAANEKSADKPLDLGGFKRLPPGIKNGVGKIQSVEWLTYGPDEKVVAKRGEEYVRVCGVVRFPKDHNGEKIEGHQMYLFFPLCDIPANPANQFSKPFTFEEGVSNLLQFFKRFNVAMCQENSRTDPSGQKTMAYYQATVQLLNGRHDHYEFSTRAWRPKDAKEDRVEEEWGKMCQWPPAGANGVAHDPAAGMKDNLEPSAPVTRPPAPPMQFAAAPPTSAPVPPGVMSEFDQPAADPADLVRELVEVAVGDPTGQTPDGAEAITQLQGMAAENGWAKEQVDSAPDWGAVGEMALSHESRHTPPPTEAAPPPREVVPTIGSRVKFCKRDMSNGNKLKNDQGVAFPPSDVEVVTVDAANRTCTVKSAKDGKSILDMRTKKPTVVKWEWLE